MAAAGVWEECCGAAEGFSHAAVVRSSAGFGHAAVHGAAESDRSSAQFNDSGSAGAPRLQSLPGALDTLSVPLSGTDSVHTVLIPLVCFSLACVMANSNKKKCILHYN